MKYRLPLLCTMTVVCFSNLTCNSAIDLPSTGKRSEPPDSSKSDDTDQIESVIQQYERLGNKLIAILADEEEPTKLRSDAARTFGRMKYVPAIQTLIQQLTLVDPTRHSTGDDLEPLVCLLALIEYGNLAVPNVVGAYLAEPDPIKHTTRREDQRRHLLLILIRREKKVSNIYFQGLVATKDARITKAKLAEWTDYMEK